MATYQHETVSAYSRSSIQSVVVQTVIPRSWGFGSASESEPVSRVKGTCAGSFKLTTDNHFENQCKTAGRVQITYTLEAMVQLTGTIVHYNCQLCVHSFEKDTTVAMEL